MSRKLRAVHSIARVTLKELLRDKVLYNGILASIALFFFSLLASNLSFVRASRIMIDFGISALSICSLFVAVFLSAPLIGREIERRTFFVALSKPITRSEFVLGKFCGISAIVALNWCVLVAFFLAFLLTMGGEISSTLILGMLLILMQSFLLAGIAIFFSTFTTTSLSVAFSIGIYLIGINFSQMQLLIAKMGETSARDLLSSAVYLVPAFEKFNLGNQITYALPVSAGEFFGTLLYGLGFLGILLFASFALIQRRES
jgi:Cu-processing system permease protein